MTDGNITRTHTVTDLLVTEIDTILDTVAGMSSSTDMVVVGPLCDAGGCARRRLIPSGGAWLADFTAAPGASTPEEQYPYDITAGVGGDAVQYDADSDGTARACFSPYLLDLTLVLR